MVLVKYPSTSIVASGWGVLCQVLGSIIGFVFSGLVDFGGFVGLDRIWLAWGDCRQPTQDAMGSWRTRTKANDVWEHGRNLTGIGGAEVGGRLLYVYFKRPGGEEKEPSCEVAHFILWRVGMVATPHFCRQTIYFQ